ncbi:hypothetical protein CL635_03300, partial [bacterium]|nr:hypothetical protein [bacterium]
MMPIAEAASGVPKVLNYQGRLLSATGTLLGGASGVSYCFKFSFYDAASGGNKVWPTSNPSTSTITVTNGVFNTGIGDTTTGGDALDYDFQSTSTVFLDIVVGERGDDNDCDSGGDETMETLTPRQQVYSAGYAINSDTVDGFHAVEYATSSQIPVLTNGELILGSSTPSVTATGTNALTLQNRSTGNINFFSAATATISTAGTLTIAGLLQSTASGDNYFSGNLGVGLTSPSVRLEIAGTASSTGLVVNGTATTTNLAATTATTTNFFAETATTTNLAATTATTTNFFAETATTTNLTVVSLTASRLLQGGTGGALASVSDLTSWLTGGSAIRVADDGDGTATVINEGVTSLSVGTGFSVDNSTGSVTISTDIAFATSGNANIRIASSSGVWTWSQPTSTASVSGFLSSADWSTFSNKITTSSPVTAGFFPIWTGVNTLQGTSSIFETGGNVGIGTSTPEVEFVVADPGGGNLAMRLAADSAANLDIYSDIPAGGGSVNSQVRFWNQGAFKSVIGFNDDSGNFEIDVSTASSLDDTPMFAIDSSGNVGIGTASPASKLHVSSTDATDQTLILDGGSNDWNAIRFREVATARWDIGLANDEGFYIYDVDQAAHRLRIDGSGNVGIGTTTPQRKLHIIEATLDNTLRLESGDAKSSFELVDNTETVAIFQTAGVLHLDVADDGSGDLVIDTSGNVGIGTTTPQAELHLFTATPTFIIEDSGTSQTQIKMESNRGTSDANLGVVNFLWDGTSVAQIVGETGDDTTNKDDGLISFHVTEGGSQVEAMRIEQDGNIGIGTTTPATTLHVDGTFRVTDASVMLGDITFGDTVGDAKIETEPAEATPAYTFRNDTDTGMYRAGANTIGFSTNGVQRVEIGSTGLFGVGDADPDFGLEIVASSSNGWFGITDSSDGDILVVDENKNIGINQASPAEPLHIVADSGDDVLRLEENSGGEYYDIEVSSDGDLLFKTDGGTTALQLLDATGQASFIGGAEGAPSITPNGDTNTGMWFPAGDTIAWSEGGAEAMRIDSSGQVG